MKLLHCYRKKAWALEVSLFQKAIKELWEDHIGYREKSEALLEIFRMAGYLSKDKLLDYVIKLEFKNPFDVWHKLCKSVDDNFSENYGLSIEDIEKLIIYISQNAFGRNAGEERNALQTQNWQESCKKEYLEQAGKLGMVQKISPNKEYDYTLIPGASYSAVKNRIETYTKTVEQRENVFVLGGNRELCKELDGEDYIKSLADKLCIKHTGSFVMKNGRTYLNSDNPITETEMIQDVLKESKLNFIVVNSIVENNRPTTIDTFFSFIEQTKFKGDAEILVWSKQPYILRQATDAKIAFLTKGIKTCVKGAGMGSGGNVKAIDSELAALIATLYKYNKLEKTGEIPDCSYLMFQTRDKSDPIIPSEWTEDFYRAEDSWHKLIGEYVY